jgi:hypothetical protein
MSELKPKLPLHPWGDVLFSERGTLMAVVVMGFLLTIKYFAVR